jgi:hypothetical protein
MQVQTNEDITALKKFLDHRIAVVCPCRISFGEDWISVSYFVETFRQPRFVKCAVPRYLV